MKSTHYSSLKGGVSGKRIIWGGEDDTEEVNVMQIISHSSWDVWVFEWRHSWIQTPEYKLVRALTSSPDSKLKELSHIILPEKIRINKPIRHPLFLFQELIEKERSHHEVLLSNVSISSSCRLYCSLVVAKQEINTSLYLSLESSQTQVLIKGWTSSSAFNLHLTRVLEVVTQCLWIPNLERKRNDSNLCQHFLWQRQLYFGRELLIAFSWSIVWKQQSRSTNSSIDCWNEREINKLKITGRHVSSEESFPWSTLNFLFPEQTESSCRKKCLANDNRVDETEDTSTACLISISLLLWRCWLRLSMTGEKRGVMKDSPKHRCQRWQDLRWHCLMTKNRCRQSRQEWRKQGCCTSWQVWGRTSSWVKVKGEGWMKSAEASSCSSWKLGKSGRILRKFVRCSWVQVWDERENE